MFKVLVIVFDFPPVGLSGVQRTLKFVKYMPQFSWQPTVVTNSKIKHFAIDKSLLDELQNSAIRIIRVPELGSDLKSKNFSNRKISGEFFRRLWSKVEQTFFFPDKKKSWVNSASKVIDDLLAKETFNAIFISGPPFSLFKLVSALKIKFRIPIIIDYRELWYKGYTSFYPTLIHKKINKIIEYKALKAADGIVVSNRKIKEKLIENFKFLTFNDVRIITNGFDPQDYEGIVILPKNNTRMRLLFSGIFLFNNSPKYFLEAFKKLSIQQPDIAKNIELHFTGFLRNEDQKIIRNLSLQEFIYNHGFLGHKDAIKILVGSDVVWLSLNDKKYNESVLPGKMYETFAAKKPLIACLPEGAAKIVAQEYPATFFCESENTDQIYKVIAEVYKQYSTGRLPSVSDDFLVNFRRDYLTEQLTKLFNQLLKIHET